MLHSAKCSKTGGDWMDDKSEWNEENWQEDEEGLLWTPLLTSLAAHTNALSSTAVLTILCWKKIKK